MAQIVVNRGNRTVAESVRELLRDGVDETDAQRMSVSIASAYFNYGGWWSIADVLESMSHVRLLLGAEPANPASDGERLSDGSSRFLWDDLPNPEQSTILRLLIDWLKDGAADGSVEVRRMNSARFLHGKAFITALTDEDRSAPRKPQGVLLGSANLTLAGMTKNSELCVSMAEPDTAVTAMEWFDELWQQADDYMQGIIDRHHAHCDSVRPWLIYLRVLWEMYGKEPEPEQNLAGHHLGHGLYGFQADGAARARRILDQHSGVVIADEVGLGKTHIAGALIAQESTQGRRVLVCVPKSLLQMWENFLAHQGLKMGDVRLVSHSQLVPAMKAQGKKPKGAPISFRTMKKFDTFVIDEAHNFRNPKAQRSAALRSLVLGEDKRVVCLTATPVSNSVHDLYWLMRLYIRNGMHFAAQTGGHSLFAHFKEAERRAASGGYDPDFMFDLLSEAIVRRTRKSVMGNADKDHNGEPIRFPKTQALRIDYDLEAVMPGCFQAVYDALAPESLESDVTPDRRLTLAAYRPADYVVDKNAIEGMPQMIKRAAHISGLLRSGMLKRYESSPAAFAATCERMSGRCTKFLEAMNRGVLKTVESVPNSDSDEETPVGFGDSVDGALFLSQCDVPQLKADVEGDRDLLNSFASQASSVRAEDDPNLTALIERLREIASEAAAEHVNEQQQRDCRKVVVFSAFKDTVEWIAERVETAIKDASVTSGLSLYADRMSRAPRIATLTGADKENKHDEVLAGFAPRTIGGDSEDVYDILVCTDVLSEGVNLHQARHVINYDLPWNPMRLVQRHGRVDRIGSEHETVYVHSVFPDRQLERVLRLEAVLHRKMREALNTTGSSEVLPGYGERDAVFAGQDDEIRKLAENDASLFERGGTVRSTESGDEFRQELRNASNDLIRQKILGLLPAAGTVKHARNIDEQGFVFCAKADGRGKPYLRHVAPHRQWAVTSGALNCLTALRSAAEDLPAEPTTENFQSEAHHAWQLAKEDIVRCEGEAAALIDTAPYLKPVQRDAIKTLRQAIGTLDQPAGVEKAICALTQEIDGATAKALQDRLYPKRTSHKPTAVQIIEAVREAGLSASTCSSKSRPLHPDDLTVVCWAGIIGAEATDPMPAAPISEAAEQDGPPDEETTRNETTTNGSSTDEPVRWPWETAE